VSTPRAQLAEELLRRLAAALRSGQLYSRGHPIIGRNLEALSTVLQLLHALNPTVVIGLIGKELFPLSAVVQSMRKTQQTSLYLDRLGPFFIGRAIWRAPAHILT